MKMEYQKGIVNFIAMCRKYAKNSDTEITLAKNMMNDENASGEFLKNHPQFLETNFEESIIENKLILDSAMCYIFEWNMKNITELQDLLLKAMFYLKDHCFLNEVNNQYYSFEGIMNSVFSEIASVYDNPEDELFKLREFLNNNNELTVKIINKQFPNIFSLSLVKWNFSTIESLIKELNKCLDMKEDKEQIKSIAEILKRINELKKHITTSTRKELDSFVGYYI